MVAIVTLMLVASAAVPILAADDPSASTIGHNGEQQAKDRFNMTSGNGTGQHLDQAGLMKLFQALPDKDPLFAPLNDTNGNITGRYISFMADPSNGTLQNYAVNVSGKSIPIFTSVVASNFKPTTSNVSGPLFMETNGNLSMSAHNNPTGSLVVRAADAASINLSMPAGFTAMPAPQSDDTVKAWMINGNDITAGLATKNATVTTNLGSSASTAGYVNVSLAPGGALIFATLPVAGGFPAADNLFLLSQMSNWSIEGAAAMISTANNTFWYATEAGSLTPAVNASKGDVIVNLTPMNMTGAANGTDMDRQVNGQRVWYVLAMDKNTMNPANGTPQVMVNGQSLNLANSSSELATSTSSFWMFQGTNASIFVVPLPGNNASVSIEVKEGTANAPSTTASASSSAATGVAIVVIGMAGLVGAGVYFRKKK